MTENCPFCGKDVPDGALLCKGCGARRESADALKEKGGGLLHLALWGVISICIIVFIICLAVVGFNDKSHATLAGCLILSVLCYLVLHRTNRPDQATAPEWMAPPDAGAAVARHLERERADDGAAAFLASVRARLGRLSCERCGIDPVAAYGAADGEACMEAHRRDTASAEQAPFECLCANCHRVAHRRMGTPAVAP